MRLHAVTPLAHPVDEVFAWHERPGAVERLTPPGFGRIESPPSDGLRVGSRTVLRVNVPGARLPGRAPFGVRWVAEHDAYEPGRGFSDVMVSGPLRSWHHEHAFTPSGAGTTIRDEVRLELPVVSRVPGVGPLGERVVAEQMRRFFAFRGRQLRDDLAFHAEHRRPPRTVVIAGASGLVGRQLTALLGTGGHEVWRLVRHEADPRAREIAWDPAIGRLDPHDLARADVVVNLAGEPIAGRFTDSHLARVRDSRVSGTRLIADALATLSADGRSRALVNASASGYYGPDRGDNVLTEDAGPGSGALAAIVEQWERATTPAADAGVRVVLVRSGIVQSPASGQLALQLPIFTAGLGGPLGDGTQWIPWIGIDDAVGLYAHVALDDAASGPVNACAPEPVTGNDYARTLAAVLRRPAALRVPSAAPAALLAERGAREFALAGQRMSAGRAEAIGYRFRHRDLTACLRHVLATTADGPTRTSTSTSIAPAPAT